VAIAVLRCLQVLVYVLLSTASVLLRDKGTSVSSAFGLQTDFWWKTVGWRNGKESLVKATLQLSIGYYFVEISLLILFLSLAFIFNIDHRDKVLLFTHS